jgi:hypothetical protein
VTEENWKEFGDMKDMMGEHGRFLVGEDDQMYQIFAETDIRVVSKTLRSAVLKLMHGRMVVGHWFFLRKAAILRKRFWWAGWYTAVEKQVADCLACRLSRIKRSRHQAKMQVWHPKARFETISVDVLELSPTSIHRWKTTRVRPSVITSLGSLLALSSTVREACPCAQN